ncbi:3-oxoacyl-(Acyl-carrier protein) reductase [Candidatus Moduliflexus flocculans]|uniref:3-oxoacyl-[acyl-carrier-protein] reductase n=1 Tax=Candidatus Moduliflexus flocculans TaxID=1499966 RepID=A0A081BNF6_9BACT|nr:3-oxoacyl-(Acyl-carrier protein) reductase [Candidatus Moduliflexus flocculans]
MKQELEGKIAIVTGASRGIGRAIALNLAAAGANIVAVYQQNKTMVDELAQEIEPLGRVCLAVKADVAVEDEVNALVDQTMSQFGRVDILINNAGITKDGLIMRMKSEDWHNVLNVNLSGMFYATKAVTKPMFKQRSGKIVFVTSIIGTIGNAGQSNYSAAKAGVIGFMKSAAKEFASRGIQVNAVAPGFIDTDMTKKLPDDVKTAYMEQIPLKRFGRVEDVAEVVRFLSSEKADYITGQVIHVNGGLYM